MLPDFADSDLKSILKAYHLEKMHESNDTIYALRSDLTLVYFNVGWQKFAEENGGQPAISERWPVGTSIVEAIPPILQPFFIDKYSGCLETGSPWQHRYECSSAEEYREFMMTTYPLGQGQGLLVVNSLFRTSSQKRVVLPPNEEWYCDSNGMIVQCVHCRRIRRPAMDAVWDWVPAWVYSNPDNVSHGLCEPCFGYFYPKGIPRSGGYPKFHRTDVQSDDKSARQFR